MTANPIRGWLRRRTRLPVTVFTPANLNAIDGSSIWARTIALALADIEYVDVTVLLSHSSTTDRIIGPLKADPRITVVDPFASGLTEAAEPLPLEEASDLIASWQRRGKGAIVVRGSAAARHLAGSPHHKGALIPYLTDIPQRAEDVDDNWRELISEVMSASSAVLCQTDEMLGFMTTHFPGTRGKAWLLPPTVPLGLTPTTLDPPTSSGLRLCYSGKFARQWNTLEMCEFPRRLSEKGIATQLAMVGDKINKDPEWPDYVVTMRKRLETSQGVNWVGGVGHNDSLRHMADAHVGLSWRSGALDDSLELSTKLLEYCALGTPPLLNRTDMHESIFGVDYPLFVDGDSDPVDLLVELVQDPDIYHAALSSISGIADSYTMDKTTDRLRAVFDHIRR